MLAMFIALVDVVLGATHVIAAVFWACWLEWVHMKTHITYLINLARILKPQHIMSQIQLKLFHWFDSTHQGMDPSPICQHDP